MPTPTPDRAILFDLDGTLVDSLSLTFDAFNYAIEHFTGKRLPPEEIMRYFGRAEGPMLAAILGAGHPPEHAEEAYAMVHDYVDRNVALVPLHAGARELLDRVRDAGVPTSIVTGRSWATTELILKHHALLDRFVTVIADDHVSRPKPSPEGLLLALTRMGIAPARALFVGDSAMDIRAANAAGARGVAALWDGRADRPALEAAGPSCWAATPGEVWALWVGFSQQGG